MVRLGIYLAAIAIPLACHCSSADGITAPQTADCKPATNSANLLDQKDGEEPAFWSKDYSDPEVEVTWFGDVKPFLQSRAPGHNYNCISCHTDYGEVKTLRQAGVIEAIKESVRASGSAFMPRIGDRVPDRYLDMLDLWQESFKLGSEGQQTLAGNANSGRATNSSQDCQDSTTND